MATDSSGRPYVIVRDQEFDVGWVFFYDSQRHHETGDPMWLLGGNAPILVDRETGYACPTGTVQPVEEYVAEYVERKRRLRKGWPDLMDARFLTLLVMVRQGVGYRTTGQLDRLMSERYGPREGQTLLDELAELERRGLVRQGPAPHGGVGYRWAVTDAGSEILSGPE
jgi:hypothetical protein